MLRAVIFDLDDTLYVEREFFRGGFRAVAAELGARGIGSAPRIASMLEAIFLTEGRDLVLNKAAPRVPFPEAWVPDLVDLFRCHAPAIALAPDAVASLGRLRGRYKLGCVTDGFGAVQRRKIEALGVAPLLDAIVIADDLGRSHWKPSAVPFLLCCDRLGVAPDEAVFVGDHPSRDLLGALNCGMHAVRIRRLEGYFYHHPCDSRVQEPIEVSTLEELEPILHVLQNHAATDANEASKDSPRGVV